MRCSGIDHNEYNQIGEVGTHLKPPNFGLIPSNST